MIWQASSLLREDGEILWYQPRPCLECGQLRLDAVNHQCYFVDILKLNGQFQALTEMAA